MNVKMPWISAPCLALACAWGFIPPDRADAQEEARVAKSARGGLVAESERHRFEVFFYPTGVRVFGEDAAGTPLDASKLAATATFYHPNSPRPWFTRPLRGVPAAVGQPSSLDLAIGLGTVPPTGGKVTFEIAGLADQAEPTASFTVPFAFVKAPARSAAAHPTTPRGGGAPSPRYVYGPGYYGYGYYRYPGRETTPLRGRGLGVPLSGYGQVPSAGPSSPMPYPSGGHGVSILPRSGGYGATVGPGYRDWRTGRDVPLAKPWLGPRD